MRFTLIFIGIYLFMNGCYSNRTVPENPFSHDRITFRIPAGVDSATALNSKIKAEHLFVDTKREQTADSLNRFFSDYLTITVELYKSLEQKKEKFKKIRQTYNELKENRDEKNPLPITEQYKYEKLFEEIAEDSLTISIVSSLLDYYLNYCHENFQLAYASNPFDLNGLSNIALCHADRGVIFQDSLAFHRAIQSLLKILDYNRGFAPIYKEIGKNYYELKQWQKAYEFLAKAREIYIITSMFDNQETDSTEIHKKFKLPVTIDLNSYYDYVLWKGKAEMRLYKADSALATLNLAFALTPSKDEKEMIHDWIENWIKWDDGNIYAAEQKFIINDSLIHGNFQWAKNAYLRLLPRLNTKRARDNITWQLARIEYHYLDQKEDAANRLYNLIINADTSKIRSNIYKAPEDSLYKVYFKDCGTILYSLGNKSVELGLFDKARQFFIRDTTFDWSGRGKAFLPLSRVVVYEIPENLPPQQRLEMANEKRLKLLNRAKAFIQNFDEEEIDQLYRPLIQIYQQLKDRKMMELNYYEWRMMKERDKKTQ